MKRFNSIKGQNGEIVAQNYLKDKGYKIIECNYTNNVGEIDIIAKQNDVIVFVEVKFRSSSQFGLPREAVGEWKQNKIRRVASLYLISKEMENFEVRFDVIDILDNVITHIENAF